MEEFIEELFSDCDWLKKSKKDMMILKKELIECEWEDFRMQQILILKQIGVVEGGNYIYDGIFHKLEFRLSKEGD